MQNNEISKEGECLNVKGKKSAASPAMCLAGLTVLFLLLLSVRKDLQTSEIAFGDVIKQNAAQEFGEALIQKFVPIFSFVQQGELEQNWLLEKQIAGIMPLYGYYQETQLQTSSGTVQDDYVSLEEILLAEAQEMEDNLEGLDTEQGELQNTELQGDTLQEQQQNGESQNAKQQNGEQQNVESQNGQQPNGGQQNGESQNAKQQSIEQQTTLEGTDSIQELLIAENEAASMEQTQENAVQNTTFVRHELQNDVDLQAFSNYETLVDYFYTIDGNTMAGSDQLDVNKLMGKDLTLSKESEGPQILIYHTHSEEAFADSVPGDVGTTIVGVGEHLSEILRNEYGYEVLHHTGQYDVETRDDAYSNSLPDIERVLAENPSIEVIIDLHRDSMPEETKLVMDLDGRPTARFMFFNGLSRTQKTGNIAYLYNENLEENLAFSFQMQLKATEYYPGLTRKIYLKGYRYNMHLRPRTTLVELGAQNNTVNEAMNACDPLAHILDMVLSGTG